MFVLWRWGYPTIWRCAVPRLREHDLRFVIRTNWTSTIILQFLACSRRKADLETTRTTTFHCDSMGNYEPLQCDMISKQCWCADSMTGDLVSAVVPLKAITLLSCCTFLHCLCSTILLHMFTVWYLAFSFSGSVRKSVLKTVWKQTVRSNSHQRETGKTRSNLPHSRLSVVRQRRRLRKFQHWKRQVSIFVLRT